METAPPFWAPAPLQLVWTSIPCLDLCPLCLVLLPCTTVKSLQLLTDLPVGTKELLLGPNINLLPRLNKPPSLQGTSAPAPWVSWWLSTELTPIYQDFFCIEEPKTECAVLDVVYQCKLKGIMLSLIYWLHSCWCSLVCHWLFLHGPCIACCPLGPTGPFQQSHYTISTEVDGQSSPGAGPCNCLLDFIRLLSAHSSSQEEFSALYGRKLICKCSFPNCHWFCARKCHFWQSVLLPLPFCPLESPQLG